MADDFTFWTFSVAVYARDGVPDACLALQEAHGIDVNVLLFCCWAGACGAELDEVRMQRCRKAVGDWHEDVVHGLRGVRRRLKGGFASVPGTEALRRKVLSVELDAEKIEQGLLAQAVPLPQRPDPNDLQNSQTAAVNIAGYFAAFGISTASDDRAHAATVLAACFPGIDAKVAAAKIAAAFS